MPAREYAVDGDEGFIGLNSRDNPVNLGKNFVSKAVNIRMDRGIATVRKGAERLTTGALIGETIFGSCVYTKDDGTELIILSVAEGLYAYNPDTESVSSKILFPGAVNSATFTSPDGITAVVTKAAHGLTVGTKVHITATVAAYGGTVTITAVTTNTFSYTLFTRPGIQTGTCSYNATNIIVSGDEVQMYQATGIGYVYILRGFLKTTLRWDGASTIAVPGVGVHHNYPNSRHAIYYGNRHIVQTDRNSISISHYLSDSTWSALDVFTINDGSSDTLVAVAPWTLNEFVVFMRNSIFYAAAGVGANASGDAAHEADSYIKSLASDIGCIAKGSIVQAGGGILFLSDNGVYMLNPAGAGNGSANTPEGMRLLTLAEPLSSPINDIIARINYNYVDRAVASYWDNRYYLSVPLDDSTRNNATLVYNFVNKAWESVDSYPINASMDNPITADVWVVSTSGYDYPNSTDDFIKIRIDRTASPYHGLALNDYANFVFGPASWNGSSLGDYGSPPSGTYKVTNDLGYSNTYFTIRIPISAFKILPYSGSYPSGTWNYTLGYQCSFSKADSFSFQSFCVAKRGNRRRMFMVNDSQGVFMLEELEYDEFGAGNGSPILPFNIPTTLNPLSFTPIPIQAELVTRAYSFQTNREKRFSSMQTDLSLPAGGSIRTSFITVNPDNTNLVSDYGSPFTEDFILRVPIRKSGYYSQVKFTTSNLRPSIRSVTVEAIVPGHMTQSKK